MNKKQTPNTVKVRKAMEGPVTTNHNQSALKICKAIEPNHSQAALKVRKSLHPNHNQSVLKLLK
jgi:hypothetical protein